MRAWAIAATALTAAAVSVAALAAMPRISFAQDELRIAQVSRPSGAVAEVLVSVPRPLSGRTLPSGAFTVTADGNPVNATATREFGNGFDIALVIETSESAADDVFMATKAAAVEFVLQQPPGSRVAVYASDPPALTSDFTADRAATIRALRDMARAPGGGLVAALSLALRTSNPNPLTIIAAATAGESTASAAALGNRASALPAASGQLFAVGVVSAPLAEVAKTRGGFARIASVRELVGAFDAVAADLAGRYRLRVPLAPDASRLEIAVATPEGGGTGSVALRPAGATSAPTSAAPTTTSAPTSLVDGGVAAARAATGESNESNEPVEPVEFPELAAAVGAAIIVLALLAPLFVGKRRRTRTPVAVSTTVAPTEPVPVPVPVPVPAEPSSREVIDLTARGADSPLAGYPLTALCSDVEVAELRAAVEPSGIVVSQAQTIDDAMRDVVTGRARALYLDGARAETRPLAAAVRQRNNAGWSACPTFVYVPPSTVPDPAIIALADVVVTAPLDASRVVATLANHAPVIARSSR